MRSNTVSSLKQQDCSDQGFLAFLTGQLQESRILLITQTQRYLTSPFPIQNWHPELLSEMLKALVQAFDDPAGVY